MIRKSRPSGYDPMGGYRFSERIMRKQKDKNGKQKDKSGMTMRRIVITLWGTRLERYVDVSPNVPLGQSRISRPSHLNGAAI